MAFSWIFLLLLLLLLRILKNLKRISKESQRSLEESEENLRKNPKRIPKESQKNPKRISEESEENLRRIRSESPEESQKNLRRESPAERAGVMIYSHSIPFNEGGGWVGKGEMIPRNEGRADALIQLFAAVYRRATIHTAGRSQDSDDRRHGKYCTRR